MTRLVLITLAGFCLAFPSPGQGAGADDLLGCSSLRQAIERGDGSIVAIGSTDGCNPRLAPPGWSFLVGLSPEGKLLPGFGDGGLVRIPDGTDSLLLGRPDGGVIVESGGALISYNDDGRLDRSFGDGGQLTREEIRRVTIGADHKLYVLWGRSDRVLERLDPDGTPDEGSGDSAQIPIGRPFDSGIGPAIDSAGRIYLIDGYTAIRLLPDGSPDPDFGSGGNGEVELDVNPAPPGFYFPNLVKKTELDGEGNFYVFGRGGYDLYNNPSFVTGLDPSGDKLPGMPDLIGTEDIGAVSLFSGGIAYAVPPNRFEPAIRLRIGATSWPGSVSTDFTASDSPSWANGTTSLADGSLLAVGGTQGRVCPHGKCRSGSRMVLLKLSGTGSIVSGFGEDGKVVIPGDECRWGKVEGTGDWDSCKLRPPRVRGSVELGGLNSARPWLRIEAGLGPVPVKLGLGTQTLASTLPGWLKVTNAALLRKSIATTMPGGKQKVEVRGRNLKVKVQQSKAVRIWIKLRPGAVKLKHGIKRVHGRKLQLRASFIPYRGSVDSPGQSSVRLPFKVVGYGRR